MRDRGARCVVGVNRHGAAKPANYVREVTLGVKAMVALELAGNVRCFSVIE